MKKEWTFYKPTFEFSNSIEFLDSAWWGHFRFVYDLVRNANFKNIVELGVHKGHSFLSIAQALKDSRNDSFLFGIDTWEGDIHSQKYENEVFEKLRTSIESNYSEQKIKLIRSYFSQALKDFEDQSIDLLHIDGFHTYEAVKNDFETWLPKMSKDGIVLFHDIFELKDDFGVYKLWDELKKIYRTAEFKHSHGLGVLFLSNENKLLEHDIFSSASLLQHYYVSVSSQYLNIHTWNEYIKTLDNTYKPYIQNYFSVDALEEIQRKTTNIIKELSKTISIQKDENQNLSFVNNDISILKENIIEVNKTATDILFYQKSNVQLFEDLKSLINKKNKIINKFRLQYLIKFLKKLIGKISKVLILLKNIKKKINEIGVKNTLALIYRKIMQKTFVSNKYKRYSLNKTPNVNNFKFDLQEKNYKSYINEIEKYEDDNAKSFISKKTIPEKTKISIVLPVYNSDEIFLPKAIHSVTSQTYSNWELCIINDCSTKKFISSYLDEISKFDSRIKVFNLSENLGISGATNKGVELSTGEYVCFLDHDDELHQDCLFYFNKTIIESETESSAKPDFIYSDDDKIDLYGNRYDPQFKPDWSPELLLSYCYISHLKMIKRKLYLELGGFKKEFDGSQDYEFLLRMLEKKPYVKHIEKILYHWRSMPGSTAQSSDAKPESINRGLLAVENYFKKFSFVKKIEQPHFAKLGKLGIFTPIFDNSKLDEKVTILIPTKDRLDLIKVCIESILKHTVYSNYEIIIIDNNSTDKNLFKYLGEKKIKIVSIPTEKFNYSKIHNIAMQSINSELVLFLNNDTEIIEPYWLTNLVGWIKTDEAIGAVGAKLIFGDATVQHAGIVMGLNNYTAGHANKLIDFDNPGYMNSNLVNKNFLGVTAACMLTKKSLFNKLGGFDENNFAVAFNDVDYCLKLHKNGFRSVFLSDCVVVHYEGKTRGFVDNINEIDNLKRKWGKYISNDPYHNKNLSYANERFEILTSKNI